MIRDAAVAGSAPHYQLTRGELVQWGAISGSEVPLWDRSHVKAPACTEGALVDLICDQYPEESLLLKG